MDLFTAQSYTIARLIVERGLALVYIFGFLVALNQFPALLGQKGLLPAQEFLQSHRLKDFPSIFFAHYSDLFFRIMCWFGLAASCAILFGMLSSAPILLYMVTWLFITAIYLSIVSIGQDFYSFGWESMLIEAGFFAAFLGPAWVAPSYIPMIILLWMLFRVEVGAGLIKIRGDACWRDLTCLYYHHETQPMPNPLSWYVHRLPKIMLRGGALFSHIVQIGVPFLLFFPQPYAAISGALIITHQLLLIVAGNYSWLNWVTIVLALFAFSNNQLEFLGVGQIDLLDRPYWYDCLLIALALFAIVLSIKPTMNFFSKNQLMNYCFNRFHLVNCYGAFGSITKKRYEVVILGTKDEYLGEATQWQEYEFKGKPGRLSHMPRQFAPYHLRLDWLMWFLPFSVAVFPNQILVQDYEKWFIRFIEKLLLADITTLKLIKASPFGSQRPSFIRAKYYLYEFTSYRERQANHNYWKRTLVGEYLAPVSLKEVINF